MHQLYDRASNIIRAQQKEFGSGRLSLPLDACMLTKFCRDTTGINHRNINSPWLYFAP